MSEKDPLPPINGADRHLIMSMVDKSLAGYADHFRMLSFWRRLLAGENDPEEIAQGLALALGVGRYVRAPEPAKALAVKINVSGVIGPDALADAIKGGLAKCFDGQR